MSVETIYHRDDRQRVKEAEKRGVKPSTLRPQPRVIGWDVRWREEPGANASNHRMLKENGYRRPDADALDLRIKRLLRDNDGYASRARVFNKPDNSVPTLREFAHETFIPFIMERLKPSTQRLYLAALDDFILSESPRRTVNEPKHESLPPTEISELPLDQIGTREIARWRVRQSKRRPGRRSIAIAVETLQSLLGLALEDGVIESSPLHGQRSRRVHGRRRSDGSRKVRPLKPERVVDPLDIERVRRQREMVGRQRDATLFGLLAYEGLRPGEATVLRWDELLDEDGRARHRLTVARTWSFGPDGFVEVENLKNGDFRVITIFEPVRDMIETFYEWCDRPDPTSSVFLSQNRRKLNSDDAYAILDRATRLSGTRHFPPYDLRHTAASLLHAGGDRSRTGVGWSIGEIATHMGHSIDVCSRTYLHVFKEPSRYRGIAIEDVFEAARAAAVDEMPGEPVMDWHARLQRRAYGWTG